VAAVVLAAGVGSVVLAVAALAEAAQAATGSSSA
jgi:hypothetical protein